jgi:photosystem II stability/assembly factor-like uncharacterized protein
MKNHLLLLFSLSVILISNAQNRTEFFKVIPTINEDTPEWARLMYSEDPNIGLVVQLYDQYYRNNELVKNIHTQNYTYWRMNVEPLLDEEGFIRQLSKEEQDLKYRKLKDRYRLNQQKKENRSMLGWVPMGPFETFAANSTLPISWHKNIYAIDQSLSNPDILICGTEAGGIYKSVDKGANWSLISLGEVFSGGNAAVKIHPTDPDNFLIASNNRIYQSTDGGATWLERHYTDGGGNEFEYSPSDPNIIFHTSTKGLFKSLNGGVSWSQVYADACWDIDFHPFNNSIAYLLKSNGAAKRSEFFRSNDGGNTWTLKDNGWYVPTDFNNAVEFGGKIGVTPASPDLVYVCLIGDSKPDDNGWIGIYKSTNRGDVWTNPTGQDGGPYGPINGTDDWNVAAYSSGYHQGFFNFDLEVSPSNPDKFWIATIRLTESSDGGLTYQSIGAANSTRLDYIHADVQDIEVRGTDIWVASDGGINFSEDELMTHVALNRGIQAAHFWGFNTGWNEDSYTGGKYHDGTSGWYENYTNGKAYNIGGVEEASGYVHPVESRKLLFRTHYASNNTSVKTIPELFGDDIVIHPSLPVRPNESYSVAERSGVYYDPRYANHIYVGLENKVYKSTDGGLSFEVIHTFPGANGRIYEMEISRSNPDVIYGVYNQNGGYWDPCKIWKSEDGGITWNPTATDPTGNNRRFRISVHPEDENTVWLCTPRGDNGHKVFNTTNGGDTWINKTTSNLDGEDVTDILYQGGTNDLVYVTSQYGVLYWDTAQNNWIDYSTDLPLVAKAFQINPFYRDSELRLASNGRGVWGREMLETQFTPIAQPITYSDVVRCPVEPVQFDCYSILNHDGATWQWTITPEPLSISSPTDRNPVVVFGSEGSYDISLTVTDGQGNSDTKTIADMVTVVDDCPHCVSFGNMAYATAVTLVDFNDIYNQTGKTNPYTDYSDDFSTVVETGSPYDLTVNVNTDGNYTVFAKAWIDWNQDLDFDDPLEEYDLGSAANTPDGPTSLSPVTVMVPQDAVLGATTMRVSAKYNAYPTSCETGFDGEVEDYEIVVESELGIIENTFEDEPVLYPNPSDGNFSVDMRAIYNSLNVEVKDMNGRQILSKQFSESQILNLSMGSSAGVYLVIVTSDDKKAILRIVKN